MSDKSIHLLILTPDERIFDDQVHSISCENELGKLDILPEHSNFMSMIDKEVTIRTLLGNEIQLPIDQAILQVLKDKVVILMNIDVSKNEPDLKAIVDKFQE
ncbi:hypothetical protein CO051_06850 [Candidatus Roizmanbacteria bacterium CG_4_9_14_0_2_um_filter_39_13]|uniref:ATP synthase F1 complex delta/epsilon subunit N-terminal domain-containing protein n=1 Tax=Candidatus Roizmanbacteria bacterium CG_4_9_14_0_2_um_filter_39_13 TaxID=1974839 RepID=A0A2M8EWH1_9BACT|nr:MAG: hypothetical protein COY15_00760 [Candidatus Roizmanbacteria bacterium CG_4_10_14_0_2_um_filter_39_12]PJC30224.1 MAG: hypothetical protein CO051_06850 [Candidatus Roizmanbacteria bacterium CG_4_9_14_0_2_um_filter_39_13]